RPILPARSRSSSAQPCTSPTIQVLMPSRLRRARGARPAIRGRGAPAGPSFEREPGCRPRGVRSGGVTVPNAITAVRIGLVPVFAAFFLAGESGPALAVFVVAALSDGLDGMLARVLDQRTEIGAILDPFADKLLGFVALLLLVASGDIPAWLL